MDIACPNCAAAYEIDDATVTMSGRKVRCAACSTVWKVYPVVYEAPQQNEISQVTFVDISSNHSPSEQQQDIPLQSIEDPATHIQQDETGSPQPRRVKWSKGTKPEKSRLVGKGMSLPWHSGIVVATVIILGLAVHQRERTVQFLPQTSKIFATLGLPVNLRGIEIKGVSSRVIDDNGVSILVVDGDLANVTGRKLDVPRLRFAVRGQDGQEVYVWSAQADRTSLQPGETLNFRRRLAAPPSDGKDVSVRFVTRSDITAGIK